MCPVKILIRLRDAQSDQNLHWVYMSESSFPAVATYDVHWKKKVPFNVCKQNQPVRIQVSTTCPYVWSWHSVFADVSSAVSTDCVNHFLKESPDAKTAFIAPILLKGSGLTFKGNESVNIVCLPSEKGSTIEGKKLEKIALTFSLLEYVKLSPLFQMAAKPTKWLVCMYPVFVCHFFFCVERGMDNCGFPNNRTHSEFSLLKYICSLFKTSWHSFNGPRQAKKCLRVCAKCAYSHKPAQSHLGLLSQLKHSTVSYHSVSG